MLNKLLFLIQCLLYLSNIQLIKLFGLNKKKSLEINSSKNQIDDFVFKESNFLFPRSNKKKYNEEAFEKLNNVLKNLFKNNNYPEIFIDIGAYIGLYSFLVNKIYLEEGKKLQIYSFEPTEFAYSLLIKNSNFKNHKAFKLGVFNKNKKVFISAPKAYYSKTLSDDAVLNINSMKSINEKNGYDSEEIELIKLLDVIPREQVEKAHIKIDVEGSEKEIINYLERNKLHPQSLSLELNNHYLYKRFLTLDNVINKKFLLKYNLYICDENIPFDFISTDIKILEDKILFGTKSSVLKKYLFPKLNSFDLYLFKKT